MSLDRETAAEERARDKALAARLKGRRIVKAVPHSGWDDASKRTTRRWIHNWHLHLEDGSVLCFVTEESDHSSEYGVDIVRRSS